MKALDKLESVALTALAWVTSLSVGMALLETVLFVDGIAKYTDICVWIGMAWLSWAVPVMYEDNKQAKGVNNGL